MCARLYMQSSRRASAHYMRRAALHRQLVAQQALLTAHSATCQATLLKETPAVNSAYCATNCLCNADNLVWCAVFFTPLCWQHGLRACSQHNGQCLSHLLSKYEMPTSAAAATPGRLLVCLLCRPVWWRLVPPEDRLLRVPWCRAGHHQLRAGPTQGLQGQAVHNKRGALHPRRCTLSLAIIQCLTHCIRLCFCCTFVLLLLCAWTLTRITLALQVIVHCMRLCLW